MNRHQSVTKPILATPNNTVLWGNLPLNALAITLAAAVQNAQAPLLVITPDNYSVMRLQSEIEFFLPDAHETPILTFPDWEILPYDHFSPHHDLISERLHCLAALSHLKRGIIIVAVGTIMHRLPPTSYIHSHTFLLAPGQTCAIDDLRNQCLNAGYRCVPEVIEHGEFAVRGSIIDIFPMGSEKPFRLDLFDNEIDSIRTFDPDTQISDQPTQQIALLPAHEYPLNEEAISFFRHNWRETFSGNPMQCPIYQDVSDGIAAAGIEYYLPLFFKEMATLFDYLPDNIIVIRPQKSTLAGEKFWADTTERYEQRRGDITRPLLMPNKILIPTQDLFALCNEHAQILLSGDRDKSSIIQYSTQALPPIDIDRKASAPYTKLTTFLAQTTMRILFCTESAGRREILLELLASAGIKPTLFDDWQSFVTGQSRCGIAVAPIEAGVVFQDPDICLITEADLFAQQTSRRIKKQYETTAPDTIIKNLMELSLDSPIVHIDNGIGRYKGLTNLTINGQANEFLVLEYAEGDKLYVPVTSLDKISRYTGGAEENIKYHRLGGESWEKSKRKAAEQIRDVAAELLELYAKRAAKTGYQFVKADADYLRFAGDFPFEVTPDQEKAIAQVLEDMVTDKSMDRLVCGDVGFGKTEVAMRAAFIAVQSSKQVAVVVPTTLLASQHFETFSDRFADWPVKVDLLSRFKNKKEQTQTIHNLSKGKIDIIIGTHSLLGKDIRFSNLGLVIIDEEHRFGVQHKERLKALRNEVDILTLTATPIPRTLNMAFSGLRDLSLITTPPMRRLAVKTFVQEYNTQVIKEAISREVMRGGQVYFVHNAVKTIAKTTDELKKLLPDIRVQYAHGQMRERELESIMADFYHGRFQVLVCTSIIESGIDIPTANTILIDRADKFGIAQLHQLRGRVGRSHHQAYAYLLTPPPRSLTKDALKRLDAISAHEELGIGFTLATHDLEIRGAGEFLGEEQSGNIHAIGFTLYMELLERAVVALRSGEEFSLEMEKSDATEIDLQIPALIPETYIHDVHIRLTLYKRIASCHNSAELEQIQIEMIDRFGLLTDECKRLFQVTALKHRAHSLGIRKIEANARGGRIEFIQKPNIDPMVIIKMIQNRSQQYQLEGPQKLRFRFTSDTPAERLSIIDSILSAFEKKDAF